MAGRPRRKWATSHIGCLPKMHSSKVEAYRHVQAEAAEWARGVRQHSGHVRVWVDEGLGTGWELYETVDLDEVAAITEETP